MRLLPAVTAALGAVTALQPDATADDTIALIKQRRIRDLASLISSEDISNVNLWLKTQKSDGTWDDVDYTVGCKASRADWGIRDHLSRLIAMAASWGGQSPYAAPSWKGNDHLLAAIGNGLDYLFAGDYKDAACMTVGGKPGKGCPCGTPGIWNTNWYSTSIMTPQLVSTACLLLTGANLTNSQNQGCVRIPKRAYDNRDKSFNPPHPLAGANLVLVMVNSFSLGLYLNNASIVEDSLNRLYDATVVEQIQAAEGAHPDGTFFHHDRLLQNGCYGKDYINVYIQVAIATKGTKYGPDSRSTKAIVPLVRGSEWMIFVDEGTRNELWDYHTVGRFVSYPTAAHVANSDIHLNITRLGSAVSDFKGADDLSDTIARLKSNGTQKLLGNKGFWISDYMIHRRENFVVSTKMISTRSANTEIVNGANFYAYYFGKGSMLTHVTGQEYTNVTVAWDWNLIPGTTTAYGDFDAYKSKGVKNFGTSDFVGVVSDGSSGIAFGQYLEPATKQLSYNKARVYLDGAVVVVTTDVANNSSVPTVSVLDNRRSVAGSLYLDSKASELGESTKANATSLYYGGNGYLSHDNGFDLTLSDAERTGSWSDISSDHIGNETVRMFSAFYTHHGPSSAYTLFPATSQSRLDAESRSPTYRPIIRDGISGAIGGGTLALVFWPDGGSGSSSSSSITLDLKDVGWAAQGTITVSTKQPGAYLLTRQGKTDDGSAVVQVNLADATQKRQSMAFSVDISHHAMKSLEDDGSGQGPVDFTVQLPTSGLAGSTVSRKIAVESL